MANDTSDRRRPDAEGAALRTTCEHLALRYMIEQLRRDELEPELFCKIIHQYCELKKQDAAAEKALAPSKARAETAPDERRRSDADPASPFGDHPSGKPYAKADFRRVLRHTVRNVYGIDLDREPTGGNRAKRKAPAAAKRRRPDATRSSPRGRRATEPISPGAS